MIDIYIGWCIRYKHSNTISYIFINAYLHIIKGLYINSYNYNNQVYLSGVILIIVILLIAFLGYVLTWGQMSFWGGTVITNLLSFIPNTTIWFWGC